MKIYLLVDMYCIFVFFKWFFKICWNNKNFWVSNIGNNFCGIFCFFYEVLFIGCLLYFKL